MRWELVVDWTAIGLGVAMIAALTVWGGIELAQSLGF